MANDTDKKNAVPLIAKKIAEAKFLSLMIDDKKIKEIYSGAVPGVDNVTRELTAEFKRDVERAVNTELKRLISTPRTFSITGKTALKTIDVRGIPKGTLQGIEDAYRAAITEVVTDSGLVAGAGAASLVKALESAVKLDWSSVSPKNLTHRQFKFGSQDDARAFVRAMKASSNAKEFIMRQEEGVVDLYVPPGARSNLVSKTGVAKPVLSVAREAHKSIQDERAKTLSAESRFIASQFPDWTGAEGYSSLSEAERKELLRNAGVKQRRSIVSDMDPSVVKEMTMAATSKTFKVQEATIQGIEEILNDPELNPFGLKTPEEWVAKHGLRASEWQGLPSYFRSQVNAIRHEASINQYLEDPELFKRNVFATQKKQLATYEAVKEFYTDETSEGYNTREGKRFRKSLQREEEAEAMEGSGRIGAMLRKLGVSPETAGKAGRIFGAVGAMGTVVGAIAGLGFLLVKALKKVEDAVKKQGIAAAERVTGVVATGVSIENFRTYERFKQFSNRAGVNIDFNKMYYTIAQKSSNVISDTPGFEAIIKGAALLGAGTEEDAEALLSLITGKGANAEEIGNRALLMYLRGIKNRSSLTDIGTATQELGGYAAMMGIDADAAMKLYGLLEANGKLHLLDGAVDTKGLLRILGDLSSVTLSAGITTYGTDALLAKLLTTMEKTQEETSAAMTRFTEGLSTIFGPSFANIFQKIQGTLIEISATLLQKFTGQDMTPTVALLNKHRRTGMDIKDQEADARAALIDAQLQAYFENTYQNITSSDIDAMYSEFKAFNAFNPSTGREWLEKFDVSQRPEAIRMAGLYYIQQELLKDKALRRGAIIKHADSGSRSVLEDPTIGRDEQYFSYIFSDKVLSIFNAAVRALHAESYKPKTTTKVQGAEATEADIVAMFERGNLSDDIRLALLAINSFVTLGETSYDKMVKMLEDRGLLTQGVYDTILPLLKLTEAQQLKASDLSRGTTPNVKTTVVYEFGVENALELSNALAAALDTTLKANPVVLKPTVNLTSGWEARGEVVVRVLADKGLLGEAGKGNLTVRTSGFDVDNVATAQD